MTLEELDTMARANMKKEDDESTPSDITRRSVLWFGKYKGANIANVLDQDPTYLEWCCENVTGFAEKLEEGLEEEIRDSAYDDRETRRIAREEGSTEDTF